MTTYDKAASVAAWAVTLSLLSFTAWADQISHPAFDLVAFHQHVQAGVFQQKILQSPACVKGRGLSGEFVMDTPEQNELPLSVTTMVGPAGARSFVVTKGPDLFGADVIYDVANTFNEQAKKLVSKIIADCTSLAI